MASRRRSFSGSGKYESRSHLKQAVRPTLVPTGRRLHHRLPASRNPLLLPRSMATAFPARVRQMAFDARSERLRREAPKGRRPVTSAAMLSTELYRLRSIKGRRVLIRPTLNPLKSPCVVRSTRKQVMFAAGVAGRYWGSGAGPDMRGARRTLDSQFQCRR